mmetsp:Transcript_2959/g.10009  ORF Transcript_2959/g.10009 Transcript_2959/m.10009 type:complete len:214 (-) Transcript_2959:128-769(-)
MHGLALCLELARSPPPDNPRTRNPQISGRSSALSSGRYDAFFLACDGAPPWRWRIWRTDSKARSRCSFLAAASAISLLLWARAREAAVPAEHSLYRRPYPMATVGTTTPSTSASAMIGDGTPATCAMLWVTSARASILSLTSVETRAAICPAASKLETACPCSAAPARSASVSGGVAGLGGGRGASIKHGTTGPLRHDPCHSHSWAVPMPLDT